MIRIGNISTQQVGHISRPLAAKLAPLLDRRVIFLEGTVAGPKGRIDMPIILKIYCTSIVPARDTAVTEIKQAKIPGSALARKSCGTEKENVLSHSQWVLMLTLRIHSSARRQCRLKNEAKLAEETWDGLVGQSVTIN